MKAKYILLFAIMMMAFSSLTFASQLTDFDIPDGLTQTQMDEAIAFSETCTNINDWYLFSGDDYYYLYGTELPFTYDLNFESYVFSNINSFRAIYVFSPTPSTIYYDAYGGRVTSTFQILNSTIDIYDSDGTLYFHQPSALLTAVTGANPTQIVSLSLGSVIGGILSVIVLSALFWKPFRFLSGFLRKA